LRDAPPWFTGGTIYGMVKTTVYMEEREALALRRLAASTGRSQAELIREAIVDKTRAAALPRHLGFIGAGEGSGEPVGRHSDEIVRRELGESPRS
jgi:Ribbon-helix-helix protein, copG family